MNHDFRTTLARRQQERTGQKSHLTARGLARSLHFPLSLFPSLSLPLFFCLSVSFPLSLSPSVSLYLLSPSLSFPLSFSLSVPLSFLSLFLLLSLSPPSLSPPSPSPSLSQV